MNIDFVSGLETTARGHDAIMTVVDRFSKHVHLIPLTFKGSNAVEVARLFVDNVWKHHGMPRSIVSDSLQSTVVVSGGRRKAAAGGWPG